MSTAQTGRTHDLHPTASRKPKNPLTRGCRPHMTRSGHRGAESRGTTQSTPSPGTNRRGLSARAAAACSSSPAASAMRCASPTRTGRASSTGRSCCRRCSIPAERTIPQIGRAGSLATLKLANRRPRHCPFRFAKATVLPAQPGSQRSRQPAPAHQSNRAHRPGQ